MTRHSFFKFTQYKILYSNQSCFILPGNTYNKDFLYVHQEFTKICPLVKY